MAEVFIEGFIDESNKTIHCPVSSAVVLFVQNYCGSKSVKSLTFVQQESSHQCLAKFPYVASYLPTHSFIKTAALDKRIKACVLPAAFTDTTNHIVITAGLCSVLRHIVNCASEEYPDGDFISLLGYRGMCLKSCAEVSAWTKYCEVDIISAVETTLVQPGHVPTKDGDEMLTVPSELLKFENHLKEPPIIRNVGKKRRDFMKKNDATENDSQHNINLRNFLQHNYAEGIELTITDIVLFYCIAVIFSELPLDVKQMEIALPRVSQWYIRMSSKPLIKEVIHNCGMILYQPSTDSQSSHKQIEVSTANLDEEVTCSVNEKRHGKKKFKASHAEVARILEQMTDLQLIRPLSNHPKGDAVKLDWDSFPSPVHPAEGNLPTSRVSRKCEQLENLATAVQHIAKVGDVIVDFCSGGGHLGIVIAHLLPDCHVILVENKEESIRRAALRVDQLGIQNLTIYQCNLDYFQGRFDMGICLHACGVATDLVLQRCLDMKAAFVICPCCYGNIKNTHTISYPRSKLFVQHSISYEQYLVLGHGADQTEASIPTVAVGQQCMLGVDSDRACLAEEYGYTVDICTMKPTSCSPKNHLLIGVQSSLRS